MKLLLVLWLFAVNFSFAQDKVERSLEKEMDLDLIQIDSEYSQASTEIELDTIWSRTVDSVIIGYSSKGEFVGLPEVADRADIVNAKYISQSAISKSDFLDFRQWILDSTARIHCYFGAEDYSEGTSWLNLPPGIRSGRYHRGKPDFNDRETMIGLFPLNWDKKLHYDDISLVPLLNSLYVTRAERFRRMKIIDHRKLFYLYGKPIKGNLEKVPILIDSYSWVDLEASNFGRTAVISMLDEKLYLEEAATHIEPFMAAAYCHWKTKQTNKEISRKDYRVKIRIPTLDELEELERTALASPALQIEAYNPTENWKITNNEYREFCQYALDSLSKEYLFSILEVGEVAIQLIEYRDFYFSESDFEYVEFDPDDRYGTRQVFHLNPDPIDWKEFGYEDQLAMIKEIDLDSVPFRYEWVDARSRGLEPEKLRITGEFNGVKGFGTCDFGNLTPYIKRENVFISQPFWIPENDSIADVTYEQALAYYNWKFRIDKFVNEKESGSWQQYVFPTKEEFERIKMGESVILPAGQLEYESPVFRVVVEVIPKN